MNMAALVVWEDLDFRRYGGHTNKQTDERTNEWMNGRTALAAPCYKNFCLNELVSFLNKPIFAIFDHAVNIYLLSGKTFYLF